MNLILSLQINKDYWQLKKRDLVSRRLELKDTDPKYLRDIVLCVTVAGQDTTASTLSWFVYMMCKNLHIQEKIAKEVREVINLKDNSSVDEIAGSLTDEALSKMQYLHAALTETLRLYPVVPMVNRSNTLNLHCSLNSFHFRILLTHYT